jgi:dTDP-glucose 4,6-dehydratase
MFTGGQMRILVTGGVGFIGSNFIHYLVGLNLKNIEIVILDKLTYAANLRNLDGLDENSYELIIGDICDKELVAKIFPGTDYVVHFAAESHVDNSISSPDEFITTNVTGTQILLDSARKNGVKKFLYISTDEIYGSILDGSFVETDNFNPSSPYSASKAAGELLVLSYGTTFDLKYNISRCSNNYGPRQNNEKLIPHFIDMLQNLKPVPLYGSGLNVRDWIYVEDHCEAIYKILMTGKNRQIYNVSSSEELSNIEVTEKLLKLMGLDKNMINYVEDRLGHDFRYSISANKIKNDLGFTAKTNFGDGLQKTLEWYKKRSD